MKTKKNRYRLAAVLVSLAACSSGYAQKTWVGTTGNWGTGTNWTPAGVPGFGAAIIFNATQDSLGADLATTVTVPSGSGNSFTFSFDTANCAPYTLNPTSPTDNIIIYSGAVGLDLKTPVTQNQTTNVNFAAGTSTNPGFNIFRASGTDSSTAGKLIYNGRYSGSNSVPGMTTFVRLTGNNGYGVMNGVISDGAFGGNLLLNRADFAASSSIWELNGANTYSGGTDFGRLGINNGTIILGNKSALGTGPLRLVMGSVAPILGANTDLSNKIATGGADNSLANPIAFDAWPGVAALGTPARTVTYTVGSNTAVINDATGVVPGMAIVANNNLPFQTIITAVDAATRTLTFSNPAKVAGTNVATTINAYSTGGGGVLRVIGTQDLEFSNTVDLSPAVKTNGTPATATVQTDNTGVTTLSGPLRENGGQPIGTPGTFGAAASFVKTGPGTLVLGGAGSYTGTTKVNEGTLLLKGSIGASTAVVTAPDRQVTVAFGANLGGKGTVTPETVINGGLRPDATGTAGGKLTFGGVLELSPSASTQFDFGGAIFTGVKLNATSSLTYGGSMQANFLGTVFNGTYKLFDYPGTATGSFSGVTVSGSSPATLADPDSDGVWTGTSGGVAYNFSTTTGNLTITGATAPPAAPAIVTGLTATGGLGKVSLTWTPVGTATRYIVSQATVSGGPFTVLSDTVTTNSFVSTGLASKTTYYYTVQAANSIGTGPASVQATATTLLSAPVNLTYTVGNGLVNLAWNATNGATSYLVRRSYTAGGPYDDVFTAPGNTYQDIDLTNFTDYFYVVAAVNGAETSPDSAEITARPLLPFPSNPPTVTATPGDGSVTLDWTAGTDVVNYQISRSLTSGGPYVFAGTVGSATLTYTSTGLVNGTTYYFRVRASNARGFSPDTGEVFATPASLQSIWLAANFTEAERLDPAISGNNADPDGDGLANLLEYATGSNPRTGSAAPLTVTAVGGVLNLTFNHIADPGLIYNIKTSGDPADFSVLVQDYTGYTIEGSETFVDNVPITPGLLRFLRLEVTAPAP